MEQSTPQEGPDTWISFDTFKGYVSHEHETQKNGNTENTAIKYKGF
jgi:hypothetical protein